MMTPDEILRQADEQIASRKSANKPATASGAQSDDGWRDPWSEAPTPRGLPPSNRTDEQAQQPSSDGFGARLKQGVGRAVDYAQVALSGDEGVIAKVAADQQRNALPQTALQRQMAEEIAPYNEAAKNAEGFADSARAWGSLGLKRAGQLLSNPAEAGKMMIEQVPNSIPGLAGGFAGAKAGAVVGTAVGGPGFGTAAGAVLGGLAGGFAGGYGIEKGASVIEQVQEKAHQQGVDLQDQVAARGFVAKNLAEIDAAATRKGVGTAGTDAALNVLTMGAAGLSGRGIVKEARALAKAVDDGVVSAADATAALARLEAANAARNTVGQKALRGGAVVGAEMAGEGVSEAVGQKYAYGEVDPGQVIDEALLGLGQGGAMALGGKAFRKTAGLPDNDDAATRSLDDVHSALAKNAGLQQDGALNDGNSGGGGVDAQAGNPAFDSTNAPAPFINQGVMDVNGLGPRPPAPVLDTQRLDALLEPQRPSEAMGLRTGPDAGPLENAAALSVDTGAAAQMQGAAGIVANDLQSEPQAANAMQAVNLDEVADPYERAMLQRLYDDHFADGDLESVISANAELDTSFDFGANVNQLLANAGATPQEIEDAQRGQASAQATDRPGQAQENDRSNFDAELSVAKNEGDGSGRLAGAEQGEASQQPVAQQAAAPGSQAEGANVATLAQLNRKKLAEMSDDELQQLSAFLPADHSRQQKIQKAIQNRAAQAQAAINEGVKADGAQTDQAQQGGPQPTQAGAAQAGQQTTPVAASTNATPDAVPGQAKAETAAKATPGAAQPADNASPQPAATWATMPTEARQQVARAAGLNPVQAAKALKSGSIEEMPAAIADKLAPVLPSAAGSEAQQAPAATNQPPASMQEKVPPVATGQSDAKVGDAVRVTQTFLDGKNGSFDGKVSFVYSNGHMAVIRDDTGNDEVVRSADVQRLTDGEAAQGNVQQGQPQAQQEQAATENAEPVSQTHTNPKPYVLALNQQVPAHPPDASPSKETLRAAASIPTFQGGKTKMARAITEKVRRHWGSDAAKIDTIIDYFGGSGSWGAYMAGAAFPNVKRLVIHEFNPERLHKIRLFNERGSQIEQLLAVPEVKAYFDAVKSVIQKKRTFSGSAIANVVGQREARKKLIESVNAAIGADAFNGLLQAVKDQGEASFGLYGKGASGDAAVNDILRRVTANAGQAYAQMQTLRERGVTIEYVTGNSYEAAQTQGKNVLAMVDPPYYATKGYNGVSLVDMATYNETRKLLDRLQRADNSVIYTDEAWWEKHDKKTGDTVVPPDVSQQVDGLDAFGQLSFIQEMMGNFFRMPIATRMEVVGFINGNRNEGTVRTPTDSNNGHDAGRSIQQNARSLDSGAGQQAGSRVAPGNAGGAQGLSADADARLNGVLGSSQGKEEAAARNAKPLTQAQQAPAATEDENLTQVAKDSGQQRKAKPAAIEDFGEKLEGARKDLPPSLKEEVSDEQMASLPLSKIWPANAHEEIQNDATAALAFAARQEIPAKPRQSVKVQRWVQKVKNFRALVTSDDALAGNLDKLGLDGLSQRVVAGSVLEGFFAKVRLLAQLPRDTWGRVEKVGEYPDAVRYGEDGKKTPAPFSAVVIDGEVHQFDGAKSIGPDEVSKIKELLGAAAPKKGGLTAEDFEIRTYKNRAESFINRKGDKEMRPLKTFTGQESGKQAREWLKANVAQAEAQWEAVKARDNVGKSDVRTAQNRQRVGADHRKGADVTAQMFEDAFGFRGVQFGNWVAQGAGAKDRQGLLNEAYDALMDLSLLLGVPSRAMSLDGSLGLSLGARGSGKAAAHFEHDSLVINLTKTKGAGSLAHEWFHALDNYFRRQRGGMDKQAGREDAYITYKPEAAWVPKAGTRRAAAPLTSGQLRQWLQARGMYDSGKSLEENAQAANFERDPQHKDGVRPQVEAAFAQLVQALNDSPMAARATVLDGGVAKGYWGRIIERGARSFENYVINKMALQGYSNDFLANIRSFDEWQALGKNAERYPYLTPAEEGPVVEAFDNLFGTIETRQGDDGNVAMFSRRDAKPVAEADRQFKETERAYGGREAYDRAKAAGKTKLTYGQWVQVRTPNFKAWFGDWEAVRARQLLDGMTPVSARLDAAFGEDFSQAKAQAKAAFDKLREATERDGFAVVAVDGREIAFSGRGFKEVAQHAADRRVLSVAANLKPLFESAVPLYSTEPDASRGKQQVAAFHYYGVKADFGKDGQAFVLLEVVERSNGDFFYDADATSVEEIRAASSTPLADQTKSGAGGFSAARSGRLSQWWSSVNPADVSKVVDPATGEPLVVYHGTEADFSEFSREYIGSANTQTPMGSGFFFAKDPAVAGRYAERASANVMPVYVSVQNPAPTLEAMTATGSEYDGFINSKIVVARSSLQVKSATGNNGNFDPANPDIRYSRMDDNAATEGVSNEQRQTPNGIPAGLPATSDTDSQYLERQINNWLQTSGWRADRLSAVSLPIELRTALDRFTDTTGTRVVLFRNLTPEIEDFNGVNFRDGRVFINETSQHPATLTAAHEWVHNLKRTNPELYQLLEDEVRDQGRIPEWHQRNTQEEGQDRGIDHAVEELTAAAVSDAMTDPAFLEQLAQRNQSVFRRVARAFLDFLDTLTAGWRDQGSNAYLRDVQAFRDKLADVLDRLPATGQGTANFAANPARRPGTAQDKAVMRAIADGKSARDVLCLIANGSKDPFLRQVARLLLKAGITPNIQFGYIGKTAKGDPIHGQYRGKSEAGDQATEVGMTTVPPYELARLHQGPCQFQVRVFCFYLSRTDRRRYAPFLYISLSRSVRS